MDKTWELHMIFVLWVLQMGDHETDWSVKIFMWDGTNGETLVLICTLSQNGVRGALISKNLPFDNLDGQKCQWSFELVEGKTSALETFKIITLACLDLLSID